MFVGECRIGIFILNSELEVIVDIGSVFNVNFIVY